MSWSARVKTIRQRLNLTIYDLAYLLSVNYGTIWGWEHGKVPDQECPKILIGLLERYPEEGLRLLSERPGLRFGEETWADRVRRVREKLDLTLDEFSELLGVQLGTVLNWERGVYGHDACVTALLDLLEFNLEEAAPLLWPKLAWRSLVEEGGPEWTPDRLWLILETLGMNQESLASLLGMERGIEHWFAGRRNPGPCPSLLLWLLEAHGPKFYFMLRDVGKTGEWTGERVRALRDSMGFTLKEMGDLLRITFGAYRMFERKGLPSGCWVVVFSLLETRTEEISQLLRTLPEEA